MSDRVPAGVEWRRVGEAPDAIEVARLPDGGAAIRPADDPSVEPHVYTAAEWDAFVKGVHAGEFDIERLSRPLA
jgi:uncharacterized protein DUF397